MQLPLDAINPPQQPSCRQLLKTKDKLIWEHGLCNELGRLSQEYKDVVGRNTFYFITKTKVLRDKQVTYARLACAIRLQKIETYCARLTRGGNLVDYPGNTSTLTADIVTIKTHWNLVISKRKNKYGTIDIKDFYLNSQLETCEYMRIPFDVMPEDIIDLYNLNSLVANNGFTYMEAHNRICGLS